MTDREAFTNFLAVVPNRDGDYIIPDLPFMRCMTLMNNHCRRIDGFQWWLGRFTWEYGKSSQLLNPSERELVVNSLTAAMVAEALTR